MRAFGGVIHTGPLCFHSDPPRLKITLGRNLDVSNINEGSDVYFECHIKASPTIIRLDWDHNVSARIAYTVVIRVRFARAIRRNRNTRTVTVRTKKIIARCTFRLQGTNVGLHESRKTIVSNQTLVLQSILRRGSGSYRCIASNVRGKTKSNAYHLDVKCKYATGRFQNGGKSK